MRPPLLGSRAADRGGAETGRDDGTDARGFQGFRCGCVLEHPSLDTDIGWDQHQDIGVADRPIQPLVPVVAGEAYPHTLLGYRRTHSGPPALAINSSDPGPRSESARTTRELNYPIAPRTSILVTLAFRGSDAPGPAGCFEAASLILRSGVSACASRQNPGPAPPAGRGAVVRGRSRRPWLDHHDQIEPRGRTLACGQDNPGLKGKPSGDLAAVRAPQWDLL